MNRYLSVGLPFYDKIHVEMTTEKENTPPRRAFKKGSVICVRVFCSGSLPVRRMTLSLYSDGCETPSLTASLMWSETNLDRDCYICRIETEYLVRGLYFFSISAELPNKKYIAYTDGRNEARWQSEPVSPCFQLTVYENSHCSPQWLSGGIIYHIFVDRFARGEETPVSEGSILESDWEHATVEYPPYPGAPLKNCVHFGGNLSGITRKLPYLHSVGATCLYLSPIFKAASNHKYDTGDYLCIDPSFGDSDTLRDLIKKAKKYGIRILLDGVFNHTGDDSRYFNRLGHYPDIGAYQSEASPYYDWYTFTDFPDKYLCWWDIPILPKLNLQNSSCRDFFIGKDGIISYYAKMGIAGFRLDVADELDDKFIAAVKDRLCERMPDAVLYGEVWEDASNKIAYGQRKQYFLGSELDGVMNYPVREGIISFLKEGRTETLLYALTSVLENTPPEILCFQMNLLGTHDTVRILTALGDLSYEGRTNDEIAHMKMSSLQKEKAVSLLRLAYLILATLPGVPSVYYGDEVGIEGYKDPFNRSPFPWHNIDEKLLSVYREIGRFRTENKVYCIGQFRLLSLTTDILIFERSENNEKYLTIINRGSRPLFVETDGTAEILYGDAFPLSKQSGCVLKTNGTFIRTYQTPEAI